MGRHYLVFVNTAAGSIEETDDELTAITEAFRAEGIDADVEAIDPHDLPTRMIDGWRPGIDAIVVAGGDGSINCAAGVAVEHDVLLGVLPMGTFNHFAKDLGIPTSGIADAVRWLAAAVDTPVDVGDVNGRVFVNNASIGVYPHMVADRESIRDRRGWGKIRAAPIAIARTLRRLPVYRLRLHLDDAAPVDVRTAFLFVGNGFFDQHGTRVGQRTSLTDHRLGVYVITATTRWRLVVNAIMARMRGIEAAAETHRRPAEHLEIVSDEASLAIGLDGEPTDLSPPLAFRSRAGALRVLAAPDAGSSAGVG